MNTLATALLFAARRATGLENLNGTGWCIVIGLVALVFLGGFLERYFKQKKLLRRQKQIDEHHQLQYQQWHNLIAMKGELAPLETPLMLSKGEECLWFEKRVTLMEVRAVRHSNHSFGSVPVGRSGIRIGKAYGTSESTDEWRPIAEGQLYITNKQIYFDGDKQDRKIPLDKLATLKADWSVIEISSDARQKSMIFMGVNGQICQEVVRLIRNESV